MSLIYSIHENNRDKMFPASLTPCVSMSSTPLTFGVSAVHHFYVYD